MIGVLISWVLVSFLLGGFIAVLSHIVHKRREAERQTIARVMNGTYSVNDVRRMQGLPELRE